MNKKLTTFRLICREYNITASILRRRMIEENIITIKQVSYRKNGVIRAMDAYYCFDYADGKRQSRITQFYSNKIPELIAYLGLHKIPEYQMLCRECLTPKDIFDFHHARVHTCKECKKKIYNEKEL